MFGAALYRETDLSVGPMVPTLWCHTVHWFSGLTVTGRLPVVHAQLCFVCLCSQAESFACSVLQVRPMAHMQLEVEKQMKKKSPLAEIVSLTCRFQGEVFLPFSTAAVWTCELYDFEFLLTQVGIPGIGDGKRTKFHITMLNEMNLAQIQVLVNDLHSQIESEYSQWLTRYRYIWEACSGLGNHNCYNKKMQVGMAMTIVSAAMVVQWCHSCWNTMATGNLTSNSTAIILNYGCHCIK